MGEPCRILTSPVRLAGGVPLSHLSLLVAADATRRWMVRDGVDVDWQAATIAGDLAGQYAVEQELAREGHTRETVGHDEFVERVTTLETEGRARLMDALHCLAIDVDLERARIDSSSVAVAAVTAFVRLFEAGLVVRAERVVATCPRCATIVQPADAVSAQIETELLLVNIATRDGLSIDVELTAPELLLGAAAIATPADHPAAGGVALLPLSAREVPVVALEGTAEPRLVVPAHDPADLALAQRFGFPTPEVLDGQGVVRVEGALGGLGRFAARAAAREALFAEGALVAWDATTAAAELCRRCGTVLVPRLGRHWFLTAADLEVAAADSAREGAVTIAPLGAIDIYLDRAGKARDWCLSHQVAGGIPVPVWTCDGCGSDSVSVGEEDSCRRCMGELVRDVGALDARFVGSVWPLAAAGWPSRSLDPVAARNTTIIVNTTGVERWVLPMAALSLRLAGGPVFATVAVQDTPSGATSADALVPDELADMAASAGIRAVRAALLAGELDLEHGRRMVASIDAPLVGEVDLQDVRAACDELVGAGSPSAALAAIVAAAEHGVRADQRGNVALLAEPLLAG